MRTKRPRTNYSPGEETESVSLEKVMAKLITMQEHQELTFNKIVAEMSDLKEKVLQIQSSNVEIEKSMDFINKNYEDIKEKILDLEKLRTENSTSLNKIENQLRDMRFSSRSSTVEIRNIPYKEQETTEDLLKTIEQIGETIGTPVLPTEIRDIYRLPGKPGTSRNIVTEFTTVRTKAKFLTASRSFNKDRLPDEKLNTTAIGMAGVKTPIYIDEHLSGSMKKLFYQAREFAKKNGYKFCWVSNATILLRKTADTKEVLKVTTEECLSNLQTM